MTRFLAACCRERSTKDLQLEEFESQRFLENNIRVLKKKQLPSERKGSHTLAEAPSASHTHKHTQLL